MENNKEPLFDEDKQPFNLIIYSKGVVYCVEVDIYALSYVLGSSYFMFDSNIENIIEKIIAGGNLILNEELEKNNKSCFKNMDLKKCERCGIQFTDFFLQNKKVCPSCWFEFKDEIEKFLKSLYSKIETLTKDSNNVNAFSLLDHEYKNDEEDVEIITNGALGMPNNEFKTRDMSDLGENSNIKNIHNLLKEKEKIFREKFKELDDNIKGNYSKFVSNDKEFIEEQIEKQEKRILKLIDNGKFDAAKIIDEQIKKLKKRLEEK